MNLNMYQYIKNGCKMKNVIKLFYYFQILITVREKHDFFKKS